MTPAEGQAIVIQAGQQAEFRMKEYQRHGATLETVAKRLTSLRDTRDIVAKLVRDEETLLAFDVATRAEASFWAKVYTEAAPKMVAARQAADQAFAELARAQDEVNAALFEQLERAKGGRS